MNGVTAHLARKVLAISFDSLPASSVQKTKEILLDTIGCALGGYVTDRAKIALQLGEAFGARPEATVIGYRKLSYPAASFVNAELINALDFDVLGPMGGQHVIPYVAPAVLAMAERTEASGKDFLTALATAYEVGGRSSASVSGIKWPKKETPYYEDAPRSSNSPTIFGALSGACKLLGMNEMQVRSAYGVGGTSTTISGNVKWEYLDEGDSVHIKYGCWCGWLAMLGTVVALGTEKGLRGDVTILDGPLGFWQMYGSLFFKEEMLLGGLGEKWRLEGTIFKYFPCCGIHHTPIMGIQRLVREHGLRPEQIDEIVVYADELMNTSNRWPPSVVNAEDSQFSNPYLIALAACFEGLPGPHWQLPSAWNDPRITTLMPKVKVKLHPRAAELETERLKVGGTPVFQNSLVDIMAGGKKFSAETEVPIGNPANPMSISDLEDKLKNNASYSLIRKDNVDRIIECIWDLERLDSVRKLTSLLCTGG